MNSITTERITEPYSHTVAITGGTGSFGKTVARRLLDLGAPEVRIISRDEAKQDEMRHQFNDARLRFFIADVRSRDSLSHALRGAQVVFHAAALKQVPSCEEFPEQAVQTNVLGSENLILEAYRSGVHKVVFLSTDKAVYPVNAMGMTKALMEKLVGAYTRKFADEGPTLCCVRYGNVLFSRGSVIPLFLGFIKQRSPLKVTVPEMTRFLLPLPEAVGLVEYAMAHGRPGDLLVRKSPATSVQMLTTALQKLCGTELPVTVIGSRPGEKLHETLATAEELRRADDLGDYLRIPAQSAHQKDQRALAFMAGSDFTSENTRQLNLQETCDMLRAIPEVAELATRAS
jgi:UDP-N-acetylglucosamine 4,6-dehydratase